MIVSKTVLGAQASSIPEVFEGNKGFAEVIAGQFELDWSREDLERVTRTIVKKYNAETHAPSAIEGLLELKHTHSFAAADVAKIEVETFDVAYHIIGGGEEGDKTVALTKEAADHSLPYMLAVAVIDDQVMPEQYLPERIGRPDVQTLLRQISVRLSPDYSHGFPEDLPCRLIVSRTDGRVLMSEKRDYEGFLTRPMSWETVTQKFERLSAPYAAPSLRRRIIDAVARPEAIQVADLQRLLAQVRLTH